MSTEEVNESNRPESLFVCFHQEFRQVFEDRLGVKGYELLAANLTINQTISVHWIFFNWIIRWEVKWVVTSFMILTVEACVQKQSWTEANVMLARWQKSEVNIMWLQSSEWTKLGGNALRCFDTLGRLAWKKIKLREYFISNHWRLTWNFETYGPNLGNWRCMVGILVNPAA